MAQSSMGLDDSADDLEGDEKVFQQIAAGGLPKTPETLLALNLTYQEVLQDLLAQVNNRVKEREEKESGLKVELELTKGENRVKEWVRVPVLQYIPPYFRDSAGMAPKPNTEAVFKKEQNELDPLVEPAKKWSKKEKTKLMQALQMSCIEKELAPLKENRNELVAKLKGAGQSEHESLTEQITQLDKKIEKKTSKVDISKQPSSVFESMDWSKISATDMKGTRTEIECRLAFFNAFRPSLNQDKQWGENELKRLGEIAEKHELHDWRTIAAELGTGRTSFQCFEKYQTALNQAILKKEWNDAEDGKLREAVVACRMGDYIAWELVTGMMEGRTRAQCQTRWTRKLDPALKTGRWDEAEDEVLKAAVKKYGVKGWRKIAQEVPGRTEAQCRERWSSALRGDIKIGGWTEEEDKTLLEGFESCGAGKWSKVCTLLSGRTPAACKIRYRTLMKAKDGVKKRGRGKGKKNKKKKEKAVKEEAKETE